MTQLIESTKEMFRDSRFLRKALIIACPVALQGMLNPLVNLVDTLIRKIEGEEITENRILPDVELVRGGTTY